MWDYKDDIVEASLLQLDVGLCQGPCQRPNIPRIECDSRRMDSDATYMLCGWCAQEHHEYWDEMWRDYWSGVL